jgi:hypothetical protein
VAGGTGFAAVAISAGTGAPSPITGALRSAARRAGNARKAAVAVAAALASLACGSPAPAASNKVRVTQLSDVSFGTIANLGVDARRSQSVCLYADTAANGYTVTARGSGAGGAFELSSGADVLPFDVAWNSAAGQAAGTAMTANLPLAGQVSGATQQTCNNGPATTASLIVILRASALASATAGNYNGMLTIIVGPE